MSKIKKTLLQKARAVRQSHTRPSPESERYDETELRELAEAWLDGKVTTNQASEALGLRVSQAMGTMAAAARRGRMEGKV